MMMIPMLPRQSGGHTTRLAAGGPRAGSPQGHSKSCVGGLLLHGDQTPRSSELPMAVTLHCHGCTWSLHCDHFSLPVPVPSGCSAELKQTGGTLRASSPPVVPPPQEPGPAQQAEEVPRGQVASEAAGPIVLGRMGETGRGRGWASGESAFISIFAHCLLLLYQVTA